jgi:hypothetical protein
MPIYQDIRLTKGALAALSGQRGNKIWEKKDGVYEVLLFRPPVGLEVVQTGSRLGIRLAAERPFLDEKPASSVTPVERGNWTPCPECGKSLVFFENQAERICLGLHRVRMDATGRRALLHAGPNGGQGGQNVG